jgi:putative membrane protein
MKFLGIALFFASNAAHAHIESDPASGAEPWLVFSLLFAAILYALGLRNLMRRSLRAVQSPAVCFFIGWLALAAALVSPLDAMGTQLFSAHMVQHEMLMLIAAPLIVLGKPLAVFAWALPARRRSAIARPLQAQAWQKPWRALSAPLTAWSVHAVALWIWHAPLLFQASLRNESVHVVQHASFFISALVFWWALSRMRTSLGASLYVLTTMIHTGALGALITFAPIVLYPVYHETAPAWGLSALEDQQLGGLVMWVPAGFVLIAAALIAAGRVWPRRGEAV